MYVCMFVHKDDMRYFSLLQLSSLWAKLQQQQQQ